MPREAHPARPPPVRLRAPAPRDVAVHPPSRVRRRRKDRPAAPRGITTMLRRPTKLPVVDHRPARSALPVHPLEKARPARRRRAAGVPQARSEARPARARDAPTVVAPLPARAASREARPGHRRVRAVPRSIARRAAAHPDRNWAISLDKEIALRVASGN